MSPGPWAAAIRVRGASVEAADRLYRSLSPEAAREVPRAHTTLQRDVGSGVSLGITTQDTGALRAALNTYLGWIDLAEATERIAARRSGPDAATPEALK